MINKEFWKRLAENWSKEDNGYPPPPPPPPPPQILPDDDFEDNDEIDEIIADLNL